MKQVNLVLETSDYSLFKQLDGNRNVNQANLKRLKRSIEIELLQIPIIVNENLQIIDGQHRFQVCKDLKKPIYYIIIKGYGLNEVHKLNAISKKWSFDDYLDGYANMGYVDYQKTKQFKNYYGFGHMETMSLLLGYAGLAGGADRNIFFNGKFKIKSLSDAQRKAEQIKMIKPFYNGYLRRNFVAAMLKLFSIPEFDFNIFIQKIKYQSTKLVDCTTVSQYLLVIEDIYNFKSRNKVRFF